MSYKKNWALVAHSAIQDGIAGGILAASSDIAAVIGGGGINSVFVFPTGDAPGIYLWEGMVDTAEDDYVGASRMLTDMAEVQRWIAANGEVAE